MDVRLLVVEGCPNEGATAVLLRRALDDVGLRNVPIRTQVLTNLDEVVALRFLGSPTLLLNGRDPFDDPTREPALACRVYATENGLAGLPEIAPLRQAIKRAADEERH